MDSSNLYKKFSSINSRIKKIVDTLGTDRTITIPHFVNHMYNLIYKNNRLDYEFIADKIKPSANCPKNLRISNYGVAELIGYDHMPEFLAMLYLNKYNLAISNDTLKQNTTIVDNKVEYHCIEQGCVTITLHYIISFTEMYKYDNFDYVKQEIKKELDYIYEAEWKASHGTRSNDDPMTYESTNMPELHL
jgi:hypothetical protein